MISEKDYDDIYQKGYEDGKNDNITKSEYTIKPSFTTRKLKEQQQRIEKAIKFIDIYINTANCLNRDYDINMLVVKDILRGDDK